MHQHKVCRQKAMRLDAGPQRALGGDPHWVQDDRQVRFGARSDARLSQVHLSRRPISEVAVGRSGQPGNHWRGQSTVFHVGQRLRIDHIVGVTGARQVQDVQPVLVGDGGKSGEVVVADLCAHRVARMRRCRPR
jgi:hypothetical protein